MTETYVAMDMEMTGPDPENDEIIEIGALKFRGSKVISTWHTFVKPSRALPYKIRALTGIEDADLREAPLIFGVLPGLVRFLKDHPVVGQSIERDMEFLSKPAAAIGVRLNNWQIDTFELATLLLSEMPKYDLQAVAKKLGVESSAQHRAMADAEVSMRVFLGLTQKLQKLDEEVLAEISRLAAGVSWSLARLFRIIAQEKARTAFMEPTGSTIRDLLIAKGHINEVDADFLRLSKEQIAEPLKPRRDIEPLDAGRVAAVLAPGGLLSSSLPLYEQRPEQDTMLRSTVEAFNNRRHLLAEAGTGTGKTFAYLIPALEFARANGQHVIVSTKTINLQEQIKKDMIQLSKVLDSEGDGEKLRCTVLKGRGNYLCLRRWLAFKRQQNLTQPDVKAIVKISLWLAESEEGDMAEMRLTSEEEESIWPRIAAITEGCLGTRCSNQLKNRCFFLRARRKADSSHVVVINHALLVSDLASGNQVLPKYEYLIIDEAHDLEDEATTQMTERVDNVQVSRLLKRISANHPDGKAEGLLAEVSRAIQKQSLDSEQLAALHERITHCRSLVQRAASASTEFFKDLSEFADAHGGEMNRYARRLRINSSLRIQPAWSNVEIAWEDSARLTGELRDYLAEIKSELDDTKTLGRKDEILADMESVLGELDAFLGLSQSLAVNPDPGRVYWLESDSAERTSLCSTLLSVSDILRHELFEKKGSVVLTSATMTTQHSFDYLRERLGVDDADELILGSSFNYAASTLLCIPADMPEPGQQGHQRCLEQALIDMCSASQGRALVLFTSHSALRSTYKVLQPKLEERGILVLGHAIDGSRHRILNQFKQNTRAVLLGTTSFWEGVDVIGDALSLLVITKLPFSVPSDPVFAARAEQFDDGFEQYSVPQAILRFKQGFGRLIRSHQDRGVVAILDRRVLTRSYGSAFLESLPTCQVRQIALSDIPGEAARWLATGQDGSQAAHPPE